MTTRGASPEEVRAEVALHRLEEGPALQAKRLGRLLGPTRTAATALLGDAGRSRFAQPREPVRAAQLVDALSPGRRTKLFRAVNPHLAEALDHVWGDGLTATFTVGHDRRAFRAPGNVHVTARARVTRMRQMAWWAASLDQPVPWLAKYGGHVDAGGALGHLLASTLDHGPPKVADEVAGHLVDQVNGRGVPGAMGSHAPIAMLGADRPDLWGEVETLLLGAQRQEGLRQAVLEAVDLAHPAAFARFVGLIAEHGLTRFAATARAVGVWLGEPFEARDRKLLDSLLEQVAPMLADPTLGRRAAASDEPPTVRLGLWAMATQNAVASAAASKERVHDTDPEIRLVAGRHLAELGPDIDVDGIFTGLADDDQRVRGVAFHAVLRWAWTGGPTGGPVLDALLALHAREGQATKLPIGTWKPVEVELDPRQIADTAVVHVGDRSPLVLASLASGMSPQGRSGWAELLAKDARTHRRELLDLVGDRSQWPRQVALEALEKTRLTASEAPDLEALLTRQSADLRRGVLTLLLSLPDADAIASAQRLVAGNANQGRAGRELAMELAKARRGGAIATSLAVDPSIPSPPGTVPTGPATESAAASSSAPLPPPEPPISALVDQAARTLPVRPAAPTTSAVAASAAAVTLVITSLEAWLAEHADLEVRVSWGHESNIMLLSDVRWLRRLLTARPWAEQASGLPLPEVVDPWWERTGPSLGSDGVAVALAAVTLEATSGNNPNLWRGGRGPDTPGWVRDLQATLPGAAAAQGERAPVTHGLLTWVATRELTATGVDAVLDLVEEVLAGVPDKVIRRTPSAVDLARLPHHARGVDWRDQAVVAGPVILATRFEALRPELFTDESRGRLVRAIRWLDEPLGAMPQAKTKTIKSSYRGLPDRQVPDRPTRRQLPLRLACRAVDDGVATEADVIELFVGDRCPEDNQGLQPWDDNRQAPLSEATRRALPADLANFPWLGGLVDRVRDSILDLELARGELPTPVTGAAGQLRTMLGADRALQAVQSLGRQSFVRGYVWAGRDSKKDSLSKLVRVSFPSPEDTPEHFAALAGQANVKPARLVDLAVYAPQWARFVEHAVERPGLADGVRWLHAHTKDTGWQVDRDVRAEWMAQVQEQTPLTAEDLVAGTVDVAWFGRVRATLGDEHFTSLLRAAKYASSSGGHKRAELFAQALRGEVDVDALTERADTKRHQDSVRAVGLVPLPTSSKAARAEVLRRWEWLQQWSKGSRQFGQQRRASEGLAARVATDNLARSAGFADPQRLTWAMEAEAVRDLAAGPLVATAQDVSVTLSIGKDGAPSLVVERAGRPLKNVPKKVAKDEGITELKDRARKLREQARRMRRSLEDAMVRGDVFEFGEFAELRGHAVLRPMIENLLVVDEGGAVLRPSGDGFVDADGAARRPSGTLLIAHPVDLLESGRWHDWQHVLFAEKIRQPCKQAFRELYVLTRAERDDGTRSQRYAGQQVQPAQASGLFGARGWVVSHEGEAIRTFHDADITAHVTVMLAAYGTPAEVEDTALEDLVFTRRGTWDPLPLEEIPPRLFSEVMRDLDLVVSVAHSGGYDPEASASSIEVRRAIVRETADLLGMDNVEVTDHHAMIRGTLGAYSVHLGSGTVHKRPGNSVCIIAVGAQQRGRVFLPFVDDDPRTAEVVSKVVMLARDDKIKDPSILGQIR